MTQRIRKATGGLGKLSARLKEGGSQDLPVDSPGEASRGENLTEWKFCPLSSGGTDNANPRYCVLPQVQTPKPLPLLRMEPHLFFSKLSSPVLRVLSTNSVSVTKSPGA
jgi:hypothetical protein